MKKFFSTYLLKLFVISLVFFACTKQTFDIYQSGQQIQYELSSTQIQPNTLDADKVVLTITWKSAYSDQEASNTKYTVEIDSANGKFTRPFRKSVLGTETKLEVLGKELNNLALNLGNNFYDNVSLKLRLVSSYANNNDPIYNEAKTISYTIYPVAAVQLPPSNKLYLTGSATPSGWANPVPDSQSITRLIGDTFIYSGNVTLLKGGEYLALPVNGSWDTKYGVPDNSAAGLPNDGLFSFGSQNIPGPTQSGVYNLRFDFLHGRFSLTLEKALGPKIELPSSSKIWLVGDATNGGWDNSTGNKDMFYNQVLFQQANQNIYSGKVYLKNSGGFKVIQEIGNWETQFHKVSGTATNGTFEQKNADPGFEAQATAGYYLVTLNFFNGTYSVESTTLAVATPTTSNLWAIGNATDGGWDNSNSNTQLVNNQKFTSLYPYVYTLVTNLNSGTDNGYKLIQEIGNWSTQYHALDQGRTPSFGYFEQKDADPTFPAPTKTGMYKIWINFLNGTYNLEDMTGPVVTPPVNSELFIVGDATDGGWNNPVPVPLQKLTTISSTQYQTYIKFKGGGEYLLLPVNGSWDNKYSVGNKSLTGLSAGGNFGFNLSDNFPAPATAGIYNLTVNFQTGKFSVDPVTPVLTIPDSIYITGDATNGGWVNNPPANQRFTKINATTFVLNLEFKGGGGYTILPAYADWGYKYALASGNASGGTLQYNNGDNIPGPANAGNYKITINFADGTYTVVPAN